MDNAPTPPIREGFKNPVPLPSQPILGKVFINNSFDHIDNGLVAGLYGAIFRVLVSCIKCISNNSVEDRSNHVENNVIRNHQEILAKHKSVADNDKNSAPKLPKTISHIDIASFASRFLLWGDAVNSGKAEAAKILSPDLYSSVAELLRDCGRDVQSLYNVCRRGESQISNKNLPLLASWLDKANYALEADVTRLTYSVDVLANSKDDSGDNDNCSIVSNSSSDECEVLLESLDENISLLMDLLPSINHIPSQHESIHQSQKPTVARFETSAPSQPFIQKIASNYTNAPLRLVQRLGEANWQRFCRLRLRQDEQLAEELGKARSIFRDSGIGTSLDDKSTASHSSFASTAAKDSHHYNRVPPEPPEVASDEPFLCPICNIMITTVRNRIDWK